MKAPAATPPVMLRVINRHVLGELRATVQRVKVLAEEIVRGLMGMSDREV